MDTRRLTGPITDERVEHYNRAPLSVPITFSPRA